VGGTEYEQKEGLLERGDCSVPSASTLPSVRMEEIAPAAVPKVDFSNESGNNHNSMVKLASAGNLSMSADKFPLDVREFMPEVHPAKRPGSNATVLPSDTPEPEQLLALFIDRLPIVSSPTDGINEPAIH
jgi:hypothetical protein